MSEPTPSTAELEAKIAAVFAEVLGRTSVEVDANFFALGGNSMRAAVVLARLGPEAPGLTGIDLFNHPTARALTTHLRGATGSNPHPGDDRAEKRREAARRRMRSDRGGKP